MIITITSLTLLTIVYGASISGDNTACGNIFLNNAIPTGWEIGANTKTPAWGPYYKCSGNSQTEKTSNVATPQECADFCVANNGIAFNFNFDCTSFGACDDATYTCTTDARCNCFTFDCTAGGTQAATKLYYVVAPTSAPTNNPTTSSPTDSPTNPPTLQPTNDPTVPPGSPTKQPTTPTETPTDSPTLPPGTPTMQPTSPTTPPPTDNPSQAPTTHQTTFSPTQGLSGLDSLTGGDIVAMVGIIAGSGVVLGLAYMFIFRPAPDGYTIP